MNRKSFVRSAFSLGLGMNSLFSAKREDLLTMPDDPDGLIRIPPYLKKGDLVGITSPAGFLGLDDVQPAARKLEEWGFKVRIGKAVGKRDFSFGGTDQERKDDFQVMLDDANVKAILCARGGYGSVRIVDQLDFTAFIRHPKWVIGFSDITLLHSHIHRHCKVATLHSKMCNSFPQDWSLADAVQQDSIEKIRQCLTGEKMDYWIEAHPMNRQGKAEGVLVGGNLKTLESISGSQSDLQTAHRILFLEDTGEYLYSLDRMFRNLLRSNKLSGLSGLVIGGFKVKPDDPGEEFGRTLEQIVMEVAAGFGFPVCFNAPTGHQKNNFPLKCGVRHRLEVQADRVRLFEV